MAIRPPRRSALGVTWCEDFSRGRLGVRKNQGVIYQSAVRFVGIEGEWARFPGDTAARIEYPPVKTTGSTAITFGCWIRNVESAGWAAPICQATAVAATREFYVLLNQGTNTVRTAVGISGTDRYVQAPLAEWEGKHFIAATWTSGDVIQSYIDGQPSVASAAYAGTITSSGWNLTLGGFMAAGGYTFEGLVAEPFVIMGRAWTAAEILAYYNRSLL